MLVAIVVATTTSSSPSASPDRPVVDFCADSVVVVVGGVDGTDPITIGCAAFITAELLVLFTTAAALLIGL